METTVSAVDAKRHFSDLLRRASEGERVTITNHGKPIARLMPIEPKSRERRLAAIEKIVG